MGTGGGGTGWGGGLHGAESPVALWDCPIALLWGGGGGGGRSRGLLPASCTRNSSTDVKAPKSPAGGGHRGGGATHKYPWLLKGGGDGRASIRGGNTAPMGGRGGEPLYGVDALWGGGPILLGGSMLYGGVPSYWGGSVLYGGVPSYWGGLCRMGGSHPIGGVYAAWGGPILLGGCLCLMWGVPFYGEGGYALWEESCRIWRSPFFGGGGQGGGSVF